MHGHHNAFAQGLTNLFQLQRELKYPPKRHKVRVLVEQLIKDSGLRHDPRQRYFQLLATCALMAREPMYNYFKSRRRKHVKESSSTSKGKKADSRKG